MDVKSNLNTDVNVKLDAIGTIIFGFARVELPILPIFTSLRWNILNKFEFALPTVGDVEFYSVQFYGDEDDDDDEERKTLSGDMLNSVTRAT